MAMTEKIHLFYRPTTTALRGFSWRDVDEEKGVTHWYPDPGEYIGCYEGPGHDQMVIGWATNRIKLLGLGDKVGQFVNFLFTVAESPLG